MAGFATTRGLDMLSSASTILLTYKNGQAVRSSASEVDIHVIGPNTPEQMLMRGSFTAFSGGKPTAGALSSVVQTEERFNGAAVEVATYTGLSISVEQFLSFVSSGDAAAFLAFCYAGVDTITGSFGDDILYGYGGDDSIDGRSGADTMTGGTGSDSYGVDNAGDTVVETSAAGTDTVESSISLLLAANVENLILTGSAATAGTGNSLANTISGNGGANILNGAAGADTMKGGHGDDSYVVDNLGDKVVESSATGGIDTVQSSTSFTLGANVENLILGGSAAASGIGNGLVNSITGNGAANILNGAAGADTMKGGNGNDSYVVDNPGDKVVETSATGGTDGVQSSVTYTLTANVENLILAGTSSIGGTGNGSANKLTGNAGANLLKGEGGADAISGAAGADKLYGGAGSDVLSGGAGNDMLRGDNVTADRGQDKFLFDRVPNGATNRDSLEDFNPVDDSILLKKGIFAIATTATPTGPAPAPIAPSAFKRIDGYDPAAPFARPFDPDPSDRIIYDQAGGKIFYDADGSGATAAILFATVSPGTVLTSADFLISI